MTDSATRHARVRAGLGDRAHPVDIGPGVRHSLSGIVEQLGARRAAVVSARPDAWTPDPGVPSPVVRARDGEADTTLATVEGPWREFVRFGPTRDDVVVSVGGGTTTDVVGLAAALFHRGVLVVHLATTLLAQVDAGVGGRTAVNPSEGKNLIGVGDLRELTPAVQIAASVARKAQIVSADERDTGLRDLPCWTARTAASRCRICRSRSSRGCWRRWRAQRPERGRTRQVVRVGPDGDSSGPARTMSFRAADGSTTVTGDRSGPHRFRQGAEAPPDARVQRIGTARRVCLGERGRSRRRRRRSPWWWGRSRAVRCRGRCRSGPAGRARR
ncbi:hypothetical protein [Streptomyces cinerochromogenes]|uniref:hypothetical protein n=1 Tax=Streptomyces cinerochromogenes TaxID=66422 RepID=UPI0019CD7A6C|nr:hypothetical protein [Streptomyces cinerochromogenes]GGS56627.1 hypothetical protein GCM10010206_18270 [Streptomyces cinerochromogenes]